MGHLFNKTATQSKKFWAYLIAQLHWSGLTFYFFTALQDKLTTSELTLATVLVTGNLFLQIGYILGQTYLDRFLVMVRDIVPGGGEPAPPAEGKKDQDA